MNQEIDPLKSIESNTGDDNAEQYRIQQSERLGFDIHNVVAPNAEGAFDDGWIFVDHVGKNPQTGEEINDSAIMRITADEEGYGKQEIRAASVDEIRGWQKTAEISREISPETATDIGETVIKSVAQKANSSLAEQAPKSRSEVIFAPLKEEEKPREIDFSHLLGDEEKNYTVEDSAVRTENERANFTDQSIAAAAENISKIQTEERELFDRIKDALGDIDFTEMANGLRNNEDLRITVGSYLLRKVDEIAAELPGRMRRNEQKKPNMTGYPRTMTAREYAAVLALSMLDGTFRKERGDIEDAPGKEMRNGQSRYAARVLLGLEKSTLR